MKKLLLPLTLVLSLFALTSTPAQTAPPNSVTYTFTTMDTEGGRSNATGTVVLQPLPNGKTLVRIQARGLQMGGEYFLTWSTGTSCALETDNGEDVRALQGSPERQPERHGAARDRPDLDRLAGHPHRDRTGSGGVRRLDALT